MFGFSEPEYIVKDEIHSTRDGRPERLQLRAPSEAWLKAAEDFKATLRHTSLPPNATLAPEGCEGHAYISFEGCLDVLLLYEADSLAQADWARLQANPQRPLDEFQFAERVVGHAMGYGRNGSVTCY
jgi:hypothetical protein